MVIEPHAQLAGLAGNRDNPVPFGLGVNARGSGYFTKLKPKSRDS